MPREIKFRAWNKRTKTMEQVINLDLDPCLYVLTDTNEGSVSDEIIDYDLMQFTGLRDKNGKEIYEGDILRQHFYEWGEEDDFEITPVKWFVDDIDCGWNISPSDTWDGEVIGNIYENPELINGSQTAQKET